MRLHLGKMDPIGKPLAVPPAASSSAVAGQLGEDPPPKWAEHVARTTVALAVLAAVASGQNAGEFSATILAAAEENDAWAYYQAKSMKGMMEVHQAEVLRMMATSDSKLAGDALPLAKAHDAEALKYEQQAKVRFDDAKKSDASKGVHMRRAESLAHAFVALQAGVILSTIANTKRKKTVWYLAIAFGLLGLVLAANAYLHLIAKI